MFAFIDTNVLLHYRFFRDVDWAAALEASEVVLVFAPVVLGELDEHKWSGTRREKPRAKAVLKLIDELGLAAEAVNIRAGVSAMAIPHEPDEAIFARHRLQPGAKDDWLLASFLEFRDERDSGERVLLLSADGGLRVKARARGIEVIAPAEDLANEDEPDETERQLAAATRELAALRSAAPALRLTIEGENFIEGEVQLVKALDPVTRARLLKEWHSMYPHTPASPCSFEIPGGGTYSIGGFAGLPGFVSPEQAAEHNAKVNRVFKKFERYLDDWPSIVNRYRRSLELKFTIENSGTAPADDVHITLWTDAAGVWLEELPDPPMPPVMPKPRNPFDLSVTARMPEIDYDALRPLNQESDGPNVSESDPKCVEYWERRVKHHVPRELSPVHFQFATDESVSSFAINYRLVAANIREPQTGTVHVKLSRAEPEAPPPPGMGTDEWAGSLDLPASSDH